MKPRKIIRPDGRRNGNGKINVVIKFSKFLFVIAKWTK